MGRKGQLEEPRKLNDIVDVTKKHLKLANLRLVTANDKVQLVPYIECMAYKPSALFYFEKLRLLKIWYLQLLCVLDLVLQFLAMLEKLTYGLLEKWAITKH